MLSIVRLKKVFCTTKEGGFSKEKTEEISQQISSVVRVTNRVVDLSTGQVNQDELRHAKQELDKLKAETSEDHGYAKALIARCDLLIELCGFLIPSAQQERMRSHSQALNDAITRNDLSAMQAYSEQAQQELNNLPDPVQMVLFSLMAIANASRINPTEANVMQTHLSQMLNALEHDDGMGADRHWSQLQPKVSKWIDQQLPTGVISTGLVSV